MYLGVYISVHVYSPVRSIVELCSKLGRHWILEVVQYDDCSVHCSKLGVHFHLLGIHLYMYMYVYVCSVM